MIFLVFDCFCVFLCLFLGGVVLCVGHSFGGTSMYGNSVLLFFFCVCVWKRMMVFIEKYCLEENVSALV